MGCDNSNKKADWPARTFRIPPALLDRFDAYVKQTGVSKTFVVARALEKYLDDVDKDQAGS